MTSSVVSSKNLVARRLRQDIVSQKEARLLDRLKQNSRLREKQIKVLDYLSFDILSLSNQSLPGDQYQILTKLTEQLHSLYEFSESGLMWVNAQSMLELYQVTPLSGERRIQLELDRLGQTGAIVRVLQNNKPTLKESSICGEWLVYHAIRTDNHALGLFVGVLPEQTMIDGVLLKLLEIILQNTACKLDQLCEAQHEGKDKLYKIENADIEQSAGRLKFISDRDRLTGLANRENFIHHLDILLQQADAKSLAIICFDFNEFACVNHTFGYAAGDKILNEAAQRLQNKLINSEIIDTLAGDAKATHLARIGEDEFALLVEVSEKIDDDILIAFVKDLADDLARNYLLPEGEVFIANSAGISRFPALAKGSEELLSQSLQARQFARLSTHPNPAIFAPSMQNSAATQNLFSETQLSRALDGGQIHVWYQPKVDIKTGQIIGAEALIRWQHPEKGLLLPRDFISTAESTGVIHRLGEHVLSSACQIIKQADEVGYEHFRIAINLSPVQILDSRVVEQFSTILADENVSASRFELELTERCAVHDLEQIAAVVHRLTDIGFLVSIDDFGISQASLSLLKALPVSSLKTDPVFTQGLQDGSANKAIVSALVTMAQDLDLQILAEGVETESQLQRVRELGYDHVQGYHLARPSGLTDFQALLAEWNIASPN